MKSFTWNPTAVIRPPGKTPDQVAAALLAIQKKYGRLETETIVKESKPKRAPLHDAFEWDDTIAAHEHRKWQARQIVKCITVSNDQTGESEPLVVHIKGHDPHYQLTQVAVKVEEEWRTVIESARRALITARDRIERLNRITEREYGQAENLVQEALELVS